MDSLLNQTTEPDRGVLDSLVAQTLSETAPGIRAHALKMIKFFEERPQAVAHALERYVEIVAISKRSVDAKCESALTNLPSGESESAHLLDKTQRMSAVASVAAEYATLILKSAILFDDIARRGALQDEDWALRMLHQERDHHVEESRSKKVVLEEMRKMSIDIQQTNVLDGAESLSKFGFSDFPYFAILGMLSAEQFSSWAVRISVFDDGLKLSVDQSKTVLNSGSLFQP